MANVNADIVQIDADEEFSISISDKERPDFYFTVGQPSLTTDLRTFFKFSFFPLSESIYSLAEYNNEKSHVISNLAHWLNIIAEYNSINLSPEDELTIYYSDEFYDEFELVEDDASTKPFDHARQLLLYNLLLTLETALVKHSNEENISEIMHNLRS